MSKENKNSNTEVVTWIKVGKYFIDEKNVRGFVRKGKQTLITLHKGSDVLVDISYDKLKSIVKLR